MYVLHTDCLYTARLMTAIHSDRLQSKCLERQRNTGSLRLLTLTGLSTSTDTWIRAAGQGKRAEGRAVARVQGWQCGAIESCCSGNQL